MDHIVGILGAGVGIVGTTALSYDLWRTKTSEQAVLQFRKLQDVVENSAQQLTMRLNEGVATLARFIEGWLVLMALEAQVREQGIESIKHIDPEFEELLKKLMTTGSKQLLPLFIAERFADAQKNLATPADIQKALALIGEARKRVERRFEEEVGSARRLRRVAKFGVVLVGIAAIAQLVDLLMSP